MKGKVVGGAVLVGVLSLLAVVPAWGGGWAVVTLDSLPTNIRAGEPFDIGFTVRQHGRTPLSGLETKILATQADSGDRVSAEPRSQGPVGHYAATLTLPAAGEWEWSIDAFGWVHPMPALRVGGGGATAWTRTMPTSSVVAAGLAGLLGLGFVLRRRLVPAAGAVAVSLVLVGAGTMAARPPATEAAVAPSASLAEVGADLFVAKGCVTCHLNRDIVLEDFRSFEVGPDLSVYARDPEFLGDWLANPSAVRPGTEMPDLGLQPDEIEALIAFLNSE